jgi:hypothetical protein
LPQPPVAAEPTPTLKPRTFERDVLPILAANCLKCHANDPRKADLDLRTPAGLVRGGDSGPAVVQGSAAKSLLFEKISHGEMPPGKTKLTAAQVRTIRDWIDAGALSEHPPDEKGDSAREHWAFRPPWRPAPPSVKHSDRVRTPIDAFLLARLEARGLTFAPDADRPTLARRASLDLLGLPPAPAEVDAFVADRRPGAYGRFLDRLLASPHFGERWARHWLDLAGYADTVGFDIDAGTIILSEGKWRYRDYVIAAFNHDKPYDRFVTEQLAGDELADWRRAPRFTSEMRELLIATGYLRTARDTSHEPESNIPLVYYGVLHDTVAIVGNSLLGLTVHCAQCHNHKFDPVSQKEYYRLMAAFTPAYNPRNWKPVYPWKAEIKDRALPGVSVAELAEIGHHNRAIDRQVRALKARQADLLRLYETQLREAKLQSLPKAIRADTAAALATLPAKQTAVQKYLADKLGPLVHLKPEEITAALTPADRAAARRINEDLAALDRRRRTFGKIQALYDVGPPPSTFLLKRGNYENPGEEVVPGFLRVLSDPEHLAAVRSVKPAGATSGRRLALARWLTEPRSRASALVARVWVNRLWEHLFGQGLVPSSDNFGRSGEPPTHPELLEWLAGELTRNDWRTKALLRQLMLSTAYRQASRTAPETQGADPAKVDPGNRLLWKMRLRRLEAEAIRDSILAVSGRLDPQMGGPPILLKTHADGMVVIDSQAGPAAEGRRSVYLMSRRAYNLSLLMVFDQPLVAVTCPRRDASAVPLQSLTMLNDGFVTEQARHFAERVARNAGASGEPAVAAAFRLALVRSPSPAEMRLCCALLDRQAALLRSAHTPQGQAEQKALAQLCLVLLNTSEFLYTE